QAPLRAVGAGRRRTASLQGGRAVDGSFIKPRGQLSPHDRQPSPAFGATRPRTGALQLPREALRVTIEAKVTRSATRSTEPQFRKASFLQERTSSIDKRTAEDNHRPGGSRRRGGSRKDPDCSNSTRAGLE